MSSENPETRQRILQATIELLQEGVGAGLRMSDIALRAGITRQAVYLHFANRAELLIAMTFHFDQIKHADQRLAPSRAARTGVERLDAYIEAWGAYIPDIYPFAKALMLMAPTDEEARQAWAQRMWDMREGCQAAIEALKRDKMLSANYSVEEATNLLWTMLKVENWEHLTQVCGWPQAKYAKNLQAMARTQFVKIREPRGRSRPKES